MGCRNASAGSEHRDLTLGNKEAVESGMMV